MSTSAHMRALITPAGNGELCTPITALDPKIILESNGPLRLFCVFRVSGPLRKDIGSDEFVEAPVDSELNTASDRWVVIPMVGR